MQIFSAKPLPVADPTSGQDVLLPINETVEALRHWFDVEFSVWDADGNVLYVSRQQPPGDEALRSELVRAVAHHSDAQFLADEDSVVLLAMPFDAYQRRCVAVAAFVTREVANEEDLSGPAQLLGLGRNDTRKWIEQQPTWSPNSLLRLGSAVLGKLAAETKSKRLEDEVEKISHNLSATYEEISLLYGITRNLRLSNSDEQLCELALDWLVECVSADSIVARLLPVAEEEENVSYEARIQPINLSKGECPLDDDQFQQLVETLELGPHSGPLVANHNVTAMPDWKFPSVKQLIVVPLCEGDNLFGWLAAFNHVTGEEFGSVEANLLSSVGTVLGIHGGNHELYRQQAEFMANVVKSLTSAIDAKDPYTCGHSDRVARISVRLGQELGCDEEILSTLYMGGLLHDIGKIGIEDSVLRKPGRLTDIEFEQIKKHPELGYKILLDLKQFDSVLPIVLHHHEQWSGKGYPHGLAGEDIPYLARIAAVADAYDAMTSDRPYRNGMDLKKVENIFREGSGSQWDSQVVDAYFAASKDILAISQRVRADLTVNVQKWM